MRPTLPFCLLPADVGNVCDGPATSKQVVHIHKAFFSPVGIL